MVNEIVQASIITIGDELIIGQVTDTNSPWMAQQLNTLGIWVRKRVSVGDNYNEIWNALDQESARSKIILITGGLGPTADDITKPLLCKYFDSTLMTDENVLRHVQHLFENVFKRPFTELNRKQAEVPAACTVLHNARGTAPGMLFEKDGVVYISLPGVPHEMKGLMHDAVVPLLKERFTSGHIIHRTLLTSGIGESFLAEHLSSWEAALPSDIRLAYLPGAGMIRLRLTATGGNYEKVNSNVDVQFATLRQLVGDWLVTDRDVSMPKLISDMLRQANKTLGTAESCTGGYIAHLITSEPGASSVFKGSIVAYANEVKQHLLNVGASTLRTGGAVSEETVKEMARGALISLGTDYSIATSGIMGPDGGSPEKPVGTVWVAVASATEIITQKFHFRYDRSRNIELTATQGMVLLKKLMERGNRQ